MSSSSSSDGGDGDDGRFSEPSTVGLPREKDSPTRLVLRVIGDGVFASHELPARGQLVIGRSQKADVRIQHESISRQHAVLHVGPKLFLQDLESHNGTHVGGREVAAGASVEVKLQEVIELGGVMLVVQAAPGSDAKSGPARLADPMREIERVVKSIAAGSISVLLLGETGVGKEVTAERIHNLSPRAKKPFLRLNCGSLSESLLESELFGHKKGAFTGATEAKRGLFETADGGTVFLDEVGELAAGLQVKLLRVLEDRQVLAVGALQPRAIDVRFISATNRALEVEVARGTFRADLFYRLNGVSLTIPPLRERTGEIEELVRRFVPEAASRAGLPVPPAISDEAMALLRGYGWPGNIRELKNVVERAVLLAGGVIGPEQLQLPVTASTTALPPLAPEQLNERQRIVDALAACAGSQTKAAQRLGISRSTLVARIIEYGIPRPRK
jgi:transcriptional regulator with AAA-type ATPase domain